MFLSFPIWLFALAAIGIPVVIHLWNIKPGKTLKVGSISLFSESSPKSSRSFKVMDILLLLLRCLLLVLLAFLLAAPYLQQQLKAGKAKGWILIPKENFNEVYNKFKASVDSLNKQGYELHYFNKGFAKADLQQLQQHPGKDTILKQPANYWNLINQLNTKLPASVNTEVYTPNTANHFNGDKPTTALKLNWHTFTPADSVHIWLAGAWLMADGQIKVVQGTATPAGTSYQYSDIKNGGQTGSAFTVGVENGLPTVSTANSKITVDTTTQHIAIYTDKNQTDANYLKAALDAIAQLQQQKTVIKIYNQAEAIQANQNWIYWLSDKAVDQSIVQKTKNIFAYADGKVTNINSWISINDNYSITQGGTKVPLFKLIAAKAANTNTVWTDGTGTPVLTTEQAGKKTIYHFYSRFNPGWNNLVWSDEFPKWLLALTDKGNANEMHDRRILSIDQLQPLSINTTDTVIASSPNIIDLSRYLWVVLMIIFLAERWLATKNTKVLANG